MPLSLSLRAAVVRPVFLALATCTAAAQLHAGTPPQWLASNHPCPGPNRTDALHRDADGTLWVGCGTNAVGYGLYLSEDGGANWTAAPVSPASTLDEFRVSSISRGHDGRLQVAGFNATTSDMVLGLDTSATPFLVTPTLQAVAQVGRQFHVGSYRERGVQGPHASQTPDQAIAESLNGLDLLFNADGAGSKDGNWVTGSAQLIDLTVFDGRFYGAGGSIIDPPRIYLPPADPATTLPFRVVEPELADPWEGELWGVAVNAQRLVAVGVDQDSDIGKILVSSSDPALADGYAEFSLSAIMGAPTSRSWARGVCMRGDRIVVVGERQPLSSGTGRVVLSDDGGQSWSHITPPGVSASVSRCVIEPDRSIVVAGAAGFVAILPSDPAIFRSGFEGS